MTTLEEAFKQIRNENSKYSIQVIELKNEIETLKNELWQQRFNNKYNLSIDQKVSDELARLKKENKEIFNTIKKSTSSTNKKDIKNFLVSVKLPEDCSVKEMREYIIEARVFIEQCSKTSKENRE